MRGNSKVVDRYEGVRLELRIEVPERTDKFGAVAKTVLTRIRVGQVSAPHVSDALDANVNGAPRRLVRLSGLKRVDGHDLRRRILDSLIIEPNSRALAALAYQLDERRRHHKASALYKLAAWKPSRCHRLPV